MSRIKHPGRSKSVEHLGRAGDGPRLLDRSGRTALSPISPVTKRNVGRRLWTGTLGLLVRRHVAVTRLGLRGPLGLRSIDVLTHRVAPHLWDSGNSTSLDNRCGCAALGPIDPVGRDRARARVGRHTVQRPEGHSPRVGTGLVRPLQGERDRTAGRGVDTEVDSELLGGTHLDGLGSTRLAGHRCSDHHVEARTSRLSVGERSVHLHA
ncbi:hypothetical protein IPM09_04125 [Candidatus Saccharibacteria bacterium]|nr:MAG: hypothetical protein IPM09_04125 [Candidatus Saccharibacteria bacterium]